ncbi:MAG TPA: c-type cytochrome [Acidobacteriaceae bacterium]|nr:c-type cytochrome [Acidobacteriaceae bacterium]
MNASIQKAAFAITCIVAILAISGCNSRMSGRPAAGPLVPRPEQQLDFATLYKTNCASCHGTNGTHGLAMSLANPAYLAFTGEDSLREITANGVHGKLMPAFAKSAGGILTDQQVDALAHGMIVNWGKPQLFPAGVPPSYKSTLVGNVSSGQQQFTKSCGACHGVDGTGSKNASNGASQVGSIVDPSYLALVSDQALRSFIVAGVPDQGMPDWRSYGTEALTDQQITDIVAWMASQRGDTPGQPYPVQH